MKIIKMMLFALISGSLLMCFTSCSDTAATPSDTDTDRTTIDSTTDASTDAQVTDAETSYKPSRKIKIACVGDSLTYGVGASSAAYSSYPSQLSGLLGIRNYIVGNFGRSSAYMIDPAEYTDFKLASQNSIAYKQTEQYRNSLSFSADIVIICLGANDSYVSNINTGVDQQKYYYDSAVALAREYQALPSSPTVIFMYPPARFDAEYRNNYVKNTVIPLIDRAAAECGCDVIDLYSITEKYATSRNTNYICSDGIHLTDNGYLLMAKAVYEKVAEFRLEADK